jgi:molecular chaperone GrpE
MVDDEYPQPNSATAAGESPAAAGEFEKDARSAETGPRRSADAVDDDASPESLRARLEEAEANAQDFRDRALRAQAEVENIRRRASRDVESAHKYALEKFTAELLPVLDSLEKAVEVAAESPAAESIAEGVELSLKLFLSVLEKHGVECIDPQGEPFDPQRHEAMAMVASPHAEPNSVLDVMQRGYVLNGRLVRAAKVIVARAPEQSPPQGSGAR